MRKTTFTCPITAARHVIRDGDNEIGMPSLVLDEEPDQPEGWGSLVIRQTVPNPLYAQMAERREAQRAMLEDQLVSMIQAEQLPGEIIDGEASGPAADQARAQHEEQLDAQMPMPAPLAVVEWVYDDLSDEALAKIAEVLNDSGIPVMPIADALDGDDDDDRESDSE